VCVCGEHIEVDQDNRSRVSFGFVREGRSGRFELLATSGGRPDEGSRPDERKMETMTHSAATNETDPTSLPEYPMPRADACPFDPPPALRALQAETAITKVRLWDGSTPWLVTRYDDQRAILADPRISSDVTHPNYPHQTAGTGARRKHGRVFNVLDGEEHARLRRIATAPFSVKRVEALRSTIQEIVDGLIDDMLAGPKPADLVPAFALPVPSIVICELLGVPYADRDFFHNNGRVLIDRESTPAQTVEASQQIVDYLDGMLTEKLAHPGEDLLTELAQRVADGEIPRVEAAHTGRHILVAGFETTANMIALGTLALLEHPDELAYLRDTDDPRAIANAVEELLRYLAVPHVGRRRVALSDIEIGGQVIRAGDGVIVPNEIANWDPDAFPEPERLDLRRAARHHLAFGFGVHQCLGQSLSRVELQVVYGTLYRRIPTLRLAADLDAISFKNDANVYGVYELPVTW
jgi:cytochrome P450